MINGAHIVLFTDAVDQTRDFLRDALLFTSTMQGGWPTTLPPAEVAVHPADRASHELYSCVTTSRPRQPACGIPELRSGPSAMSDGTDVDDHPRGAHCRCINHRTRLRTRGRPSCSQ